VTELPFHRDRPDAVASTPLALADLRAFDDVIDARSPAEYDEDHLPDAINAPVLDDEERALVGTVYKQRSAFEAKRIGAPIAARNIALAIEGRFAERPKHWRPLVYCWRGGGRSGALVHVLRQVGWNAHRLDGGYKAFRRQVVSDLDVMPAQFGFHVICGATGSGKSRLLDALSEAGAQVLDLEVLAAHRGSVLGDLPDEPQPSQKSFETSIWTALSGFDPQRPVYVESESKKVGNLRVPEALMAHMREGRCFRVEATNEARVSLLVEDYAHLIADPVRLVEKLECLKDLHGAERIEAWKSQVAASQWRTLVLDLLENHYDPAYRRSMFKNYRGAQAAPAVTLQDASREGFLAAARKLLQQVK
jgi:tRNA 2-selenouridine synthase